MRRFDVFARVLIPALAALLWLAPLQAQVPALEEIQESYRVVQLSRGWVLQPLDSSDFEALEILDGAVRIDGSELSEADLRNFVGDDADWILALAAGESPRSVDRETESDDSEDGSPPEPPEAPVVDDEPFEDGREDRRRRNRRDSQVSFGSGMVIEEDESVREVVLFSGPLEVLGEVDGDVTVILGSADISGRIDGSLTVVGGSVSLASTAVIEGDVVAVGGSIRREPGSEVDGEITQVGIGEAIDIGDIRIDLGPRHLFWPSFELFDFSWFDLFGRAIGLGLLAIILLLVVLLAPNKVESVSSRAQVEPWKSGLVGLLVEVLFAPLLGLVCIVLLISIVGIPLLLFVLPLMCLAIVVFLLLGFAGVSVSMGRWLQRRFDWQGMNAYLLLVTGLFFLYGWSILGEALSVTPWPIRLTAILLLMLGFCLKYLAWTIGLGAAVLDQFSPIPTIPLDERWPGSAPAAGYAEDRAPAPAYESAISEAFHGESREQEPDTEGSGDAGSTDSGDAGSTDSDDAGSTDSDDSDKRS